MFGPGPGLPELHSHTELPICLGQKHGSVVVGNLSVRA